MAEIDWNKVAEDYKSSTLSHERLYQYAKKAAETLKTNGIPFDGYTDNDWHEQPTQPDMGMLAKLRRFFTSKLQDDRPLLVRQHLGYWVLEISVEESHDGSQYSELYSNKNGFLKRKWHNDYTGSAVIRQTKWVLLENGDLAVYATHQYYKESVFYTHHNNFIWNIKEYGSDSFYFNHEHKYDEKITDDWRNMTDEDILLLDHKKRKVHRRNFMQRNYYVEDSDCIRMDNYLLTGKKGNGCSKKITALLKKHNL